MIKGLGDTQRLIAENIVVYSLLIALNLFWDFLFNLSVAAGLNQPPLHDYNFGVEQLIALTFCVYQLIRMLVWKKYYF